MHACLGIWLEPVVSRSYHFPERQHSSHKIEKLLNDDIRMMWLSQNQKPSSKTINRFRVNPKVDALLTSLTFCINGT